MEIQTRKEKILRGISIALNLFWIVALIPLTPFSLVASISTIMSLDAGTSSDAITLLFTCDALLFVAIPVTILTCGLIVPWLLRRKNQFRKSIILETIPIAHIILAFGLLLLGFHLAA